MPDGRQLAVTSGDAGDVLIATVEHGRVTLQQLTRTPAWEGFSGGGGPGQPRRPDRTPALASPEFSPDGHWLAYVSDVSGRQEVYVQAYPGSGPPTPVSIEDGWNPAWHANGRELFFLSYGDAAAKKARMMVAGFEPGSPPRVGAPRPLFEFGWNDLRFWCTPIRCYDVAPDGQRFFVVQERPAVALPPVTHINLIQNWFEELKAKVPKQ
jgi:hypothetical protein